MQRHEYHAGDMSDTMMQGILGSLIQGRCKALNLPAIVTQLEGHQSNSLSMHTRGMRWPMRRLTRTDVLVLNNLSTYHELCHSS